MVAGVVPVRHFEAPLFCEQIQNLWRFLGQHVVDVPEAYEVLRSAGCACIWNKQGEHIARIDICVKPLPGVKSTLKRLDKISPSDPQLNSEGHVPLSLSECGYTLGLFFCQFLEHSVHFRIIKGILPMEVRFSATWVVMPTYAMILFSLLYFEGSRPLKTWNPCSLWTTWLIRFSFADKACGNGNVDLVIDPRGNFRAIEIDGRVSQKHYQSLHGQTFKIIDSFFNVSDFSSIEV